MRGRLARVGHVVLVMSGKGGVGKSSTAVLIAAALHRRGAKVRELHMISNNNYCDLGAEYQLICDAGGRLLNSRRIKFNSFARCGFAM